MKKAYSPSTAALIRKDDFIVINVALKEIESMSTDDILDYVLKHWDIKCKHT